VLSAFRQGRAFVVTSHDAPDGDAIGSMLAMYHLLRALGKDEVLCVCADPVPRIYQWLPGADAIRPAEDSLAACDTVVVVDVADRARFDAVAQRMSPQARIVVIDHHASEAPCGHVNFIDTSYAAVGEILIELCALAGAPLSRTFAECAYVAQTTDTGGYRFSNTTPRTHRLAAQLLETGIDVAAISQRVFDVLSLPKCDLLARALARRVLSADGTVAYTELTEDDLREVGAETQDVDGIVNYMRNLAGVEAGILFRSLEPGKSKVSIRAKEPFDASAFLRHWGGGGHPAAAGATVDLPVDRLRAEVLERIACLLKETT